MNGFAFLYFLIVYGIAAFEFSLLILNYRHSKVSKASLPEALRDVYTRELVDSSVEYTRAKGRLKILSALIEVIALSVGIFWLFPLLEGWSVSLAGSFVWQGVIFFTLMALGSYLLSMPFSLYSTFVLEREYGFNRTSVSTYLKDTAKGLMLAVVIGLPLLLMALFAVEKVANWWIYILAGLLVFELLSGWLFPIVILPLFSKLTPLEDGELKQRIMKLSEKAGFEIKSIFVMDASRRTSHTNAFFTGIGKAKRIVLYDSLIEKHTQEEIEAIFAHEAGHYRYKHTTKGLILSYAVTGLSILFLWLLTRSSVLPEIFGIERDYTALLYGGILVSATFSAFNWLGSYISRRWEFMADEYAAKTIGSPEPMVSALKKLAVSNLSNLSPHPLYAALTYSHPTTRERIENLKRIYSNNSERVEGGA